MRLTELAHKFNTQRLDEVDMSPSSLESLASNIKARAGMEFEMCVPKTFNSNVIRSFTKAIGKPVSRNREYHMDFVKRPNHRNNFYLVEPDGSINPDNDDIGLEFVSPAMPVAEMLLDLDKVVNWAIKNRCYTNKSTGLHINISVGGWTSRKGELDYVKLVLLSGDQHILSEFNRQGNRYCQSALKIISKSSAQYIPKLFQEMKSGLNQLAQNILELDVDNKQYISIQPKNGYVEFRAPGGNWLGIYQSNPEKIINAMLRYIVALDAAVDPEKYRNEYLKKLYAMVSSKTDQDPLSYWAKYAAGKISFDKLASSLGHIRMRQNTKLVGDISNLTGMISPDLFGTVSPDLCGNVSNIIGDVSKLKGDVSKLKGDVSNIRGDLGLFDIDYDTIKGDVSNIRGDVSNIEGNVSNLKGDVSNILGDVSKLRGDVSNIKGDVGYIQGDTSNIKGDVQYIEGIVSNIKGDVSKLDGTISRYLKGDISNITGEVSDIGGDASNIRGDASNIRGNVSNLRGNVRNIYGYVGNISGDVSGIKGDVDQLKGNVDNIKGDTSDIRGDVSNIEGNVSNLEGNVSKLKGDVSRLKGDATGCKGEVTGLRGDIRKALTARS